MADNVLYGVVKSYNALKGFGFISSESVEGDTFFMRTCLPADSLQLQGTHLQGRSVHFVAESQPDGRVKASAVKIVSGQAQGIPGSETESLPGTVKAYSEKNGYGFIESSCLEGDVRFDRTAIQSLQSGSTLIGQLVVFQYSMLADGKCRAKSVEMQSADPGQAANPMQMMGKSFGKGDSWGQDGGWCGGGGKGKFDMSQGKGGWASPAPSQAWASPPPSQSWGSPAPIQSWGKGAPQAKGGGWYGGGGQESRTTGCVKSYSEKNGYGFISIDSGQDVKFGLSDILGAWVPVAGTSVSFKMSQDGMGRLSAKEVGPASGGGGQKRPASAMGFGGCDAMGFGGCGGPQKFMNKGNGKGGAVATNTTGQWLTGTVKSYNALKGFGFITDAGTQGDIFFMKTDVPSSLGVSTPPAPGQSVSFELVQTSDGKLRGQGLAF